MAASTTSTDVKEPTFEINDFNVPNELSGADAWVNLIVTLIFLEKGTYSEAPDAGVDIKSYAFSEIMDGISRLQADILAQCSTYLDLPIAKLNVVKYYWEEKDQDILRVLVTFVENSKLITRSIDISEQDHDLAYVISKFDET